MPDALRERIQRMLDRAVARGVGPGIQQAVATIFSRLINEPRKWGDPIRNLRNAQQVEYHGRHERFLAVYTVHDRVPIVFVWRLVPQEGNPLFGENFDAP
jgi:hypothetical protein